METCNHCADLFWDHLYGLLDEEQEQGLRAHLADCSRCQGRLAQCTAKQKLLARAARLYDNVAPFSVPADELPGKAGPAPRPATLPLPAIRNRKRIWRWSWAAAAASLLIVVGGYSWYLLAVGHLQDTRREALAALHLSETEGATEVRALQAKLAALPREIAADTVSLKVLGPADVNEGMSGLYRATARDLNGAPPRGDVFARVVVVSAQDGGRRHVLSEQKLGGKGDYAFSLPANLRIPADSLAFLEIEARAARSLGSVREKLSPGRSAFRAHLAIDKAIYHVGEILYFRSLTLNSTTDRPPEKPLLLMTTVVDGRGAKRVFTYGKTGAEGVGGGGIALTDDIGEGKCTLLLTEAEGRFPPVTRSFYLVRGQAPQLKKELAFDRPAYRAGDTMSVTFRARRLENDVAFANQLVTAKVFIAGRPVVTSSAKTDGKGEATFKLKLPLTILNGQADLEIEARDGMETETLVKAVPVSLAKPPDAAETGPMGQVAPLGVVELFPEGGNLVAGLSGRVYFRAHDHLGRRIDLEGAVIDSQGKEVARLQSKQQQGLGFFSFTPRLGEKYQVRISAPAQPAFRATFPEIRDTGVVLTVAQGVSKEGEPVSISLSRNRETEGPLVVAATCRGRLVDQRVLEAGQGETRLQLTPPPGVHGVLRITVYERSGPELIPLAERLAYRLPERRLEISAQADKARYKPGERVQLTIQARNESGKAESTVLVAAVVDENAADMGGGEAPDFYLSSELRQPQDLEHMDIWPRDGARALAALDRFLATQGWRRFGPAPTKPAAKEELVKKGGGDARPATASGALALLSIENSRQAQEQYGRELKAAQDRLKSVVLVRAVEFKREHDRLSLAAHDADERLSELHDLPGRALGYALVGVVGLLLATGCITLLVAVIRVIRRSGATTPYFATSFASLLVCLFMVVAGRMQGDNRRGARGPSELAAARSPWDGLDLRAGVGSVVRLDGAAGLPSGRYSQAALRRASELDGPTVRAHSARTQTREEAMVNGYLTRRITEARTYGKSALGAMSEAQKQQFAALKSLQEISSRKPVKAIPKINPRQVPVPDPRPAGNKGGDKKKDSRSIPVEYAHTHAGSAGPDLQATVLWSPSLTAAQGSARVTFDLSDKKTTYRVLVLGHTTDGRLGLAFSTLEAGAR
jgi:hypothetical protein